MIKAIRTTESWTFNPMVVGSIPTRPTTHAALPVSDRSQLSNKSATVEYPVVRHALKAARVAAVLAGLAAGACEASGEWVGCQMAAVSSSMTAKRAALFSVHNRTLDPAIPMTGAWTQIDVSDLVPLDARCVRVNGILMVSGGRGKSTCDLHIGFRRYGESSRASRGAQTVAVARGGARTNYTRWVPIERTADGRAVFEVSLEGFNSGTFPEYRFDPDLRYPETCALGVNGWIDAYGR